MVEISRVVDPDAPLFDESFAEISVEQACALSRHMTGRRSGRARGDPRPVGRRPRIYDRCSSANAGRYWGAEPRRPRPPDCSSRREQAQFVGLGYGAQARQPVGSRAEEALRRDQRRLRRHDLRRDRQRGGGQAQGVPAQWRLRCRPVADSLEEASEKLFTFLRFPSDQWKSI
jgi:hypothetical protein